MQKIGATLNFSSGDLVGHLNCRYLTELDLKVANDELEKPKVWVPVLEALAERGALHEQGFIEHINLSEYHVLSASYEGVFKYREIEPPCTSWTACGRAVFAASFTHTDALKEFVRII